jgi:pilus assembly protein CpaB
MQPRAIILVAVAVIMVGGTIFFARSWLNSERQAIEASRKQPEKAKPKHYVLVAKVNLPAGTFLKKNHMTWQAWPTDSLHKSYIQRKGFAQNSMFGVVVRKHIAAGQPITGGSIVKPRFSTPACARCRCGPARCRASPASSSPATGSTSC